MAEISGLLRRCAELLDGGRRIVLATVLDAGPGTPGKPGFKMIVTDDGEAAGTVGGGALEEKVREEAQALFAERKNRLLDLDLGKLGMQCGGRVTVTLEYLEGRPGIVLFGAGHVGSALTRVLSGAGFRVTVFDDRPDIAARLEESGDAAEVVVFSFDDLDSIRGRLLAADFAFIATQGHELDYLVLRELIRMKDRWSYVGMIGAVRKVRNAHRRLSEEGIAVPDYLYAPVGIPVGGDSAGEIAVSVAAEIIAVRYGKPAGHHRIAVET